MEVEWYEMPCLSKYEFNVYGECRNKRTKEFVKMKPILDGRMQYSVHGDDMRTTITQKEIIQYCKHKQDEYKGGQVIMTMRIPSRLNKMEL